MVLFLAFIMAGCGRSGINGGGSSWKTADPFPKQVVTNIEQWIDRIFNHPTTETELVAYYDYMKEITGCSDANQWPECVKEATLYITIPDIGGRLLVAAVEYKLVSDVVLFEYTNWYQPNSTLSITLSEINETSVTNSLSWSINLSGGYDPFGTIGASITRESSKTVTTAKGIEVATSYDLTEYDQSKLYKVVLVGDYVYIRYHFRILGVTALPDRWNTDGNGYIGWFDVIKVRQDSLTVKLVHKTD
ncbi:MAG TPA: hypothetical protein GXZ26_07385 [Firmicutes bacterium]|nr:hypothetical protein [Bacillota bacterium]